MSVRTPASGIQRFASPLLAFALAASGVPCGASPAPAESKTESATESNDNEGLPAGLALKPGWYARIETSKGTILARLLPEQAPQSVAHFAALAEGRLPWVDPFTGETRNTRYYDGSTVHLVEAGQRFEAGDRTGTGRGAPTFYVPPEGSGPVSFDRPGRLGMTRASLARVSGVQFFVTQVPVRWLKTQHPCFGEVIAGMEVIQAITSVKTGRGKKPIAPITITQIRIHRVGDVPPLPEPVRYHPKPPTFSPREPAAK